MSCQQCLLINSPTQPELELYKTNAFGIFLAQPAFNAGHLWLINLTHGQSFAELETAASQELVGLIHRATTALQKVCSPHGFDIGFSQTNEPAKFEAQHFYLQIVPRWTGDANFMYCGGKTKGIGICVKTLAQNLKEALHAK